MKIVHINHSGFLLSQDDVAIIIDYYQDPEGVLPQLLKSVNRLYFMVSHAHNDHFNPEIFKWADCCEEVTYLLSYDVRKKYKGTKQEELPVKTIFLNKNSLYEDELVKLNTFDSTDVGVSFLFSFGEKDFFHAGDLNNWRWEEESTEDEMVKADKAFKGILRKIKSVAMNGIDCVMFPVDPRMKGDFAIGARQFVNTIKVGCFIPMHTWGMWEKVCGFSSCIGDKCDKYICLKDGECLFL